MLGSSLSQSSFVKLMIETQDRQTLEISIQAGVWRGVCEKSRIQVWQGYPEAPLPQGVVFRTNSWPARLSRSRSCKKKTQVSYWTQQKTNFSPSLLPWQWLSYIPEGLPFSVPMLSGQPPLCFTPLISCTRSWGITQGSHHCFSFSLVWAIRALTRL